MPKRNHTLKQYQGPSASSTSSSAIRKDGTGDKGQPTVNERLSNLRLLPSAESERRKRELVESLTFPRSVPPDLRTILGVPESAPPRPKIVGGRLLGRDRFDMMQRRRTPGPPPPRSWLGFTPAWEPTSTVRRRKSRKEKCGDDAINRKRPDRLLRFGRMCGFEGDGNADHGPSGLTHSVLRRLAENWDLVDEEDYSALIDVPLRLRLKLVAYIGFYGAPIDTIALRALTQGAGDVTLLDLAALAGHGALTIRKLSKVLDSSSKQDLNSASFEIVDSWDTEFASEAAFTSQPSLNPTFSHLTHLCLSHPPPTASWRDLLTLSKHVPQLTHLSLAHWPRPTLTPNLATTTVSSRNSPAAVAAGGSDYYSTINNNLTEPALLLKQLSGNTLCLQWLDLAGCAEWMPALAHSGGDPDATPLRRQREDGWLQCPPTLLTIFTDTWKKLDYVNCSQDWLPSSVGVASLDDRNVDQDLRTSLLRTLQQRSEPVPLTDIYEVEKRKAGMWMETEMRVLSAGRGINNVRRARKYKLVVFDYGWREKAV